MYGCCGVLLKLCCTVRQLSYCFSPSLFLFSLLLLALLLLLLLWLKVVVVVADILASWYSPIEDLSGSSILDYMCWNRCCSAFDNYWYNSLAQFARRQNYQIEKNCFHVPLHKNHKKSWLGWNLQWLYPIVLLSQPIVLWITDSVSSLCTLAIFFVVPLDSDLMTSHQAIFEPPPNSYSSRLHLLQRLWSSLYLDGVCYGRTGSPTVGVVNGLTICWAKLCTSPTHRIWIHHLIGKKSWYCSTALLLWLVEDT